MDRLLVRTLAAALLLLLTVACGGQDNGANGTDTGEDAPVLLRVMLASQYDPLHPGVEVGLLYGMFEEANIEIQLMHGQANVEAVAAGEADIAISSPNRFVGAILEGLEGKLVGTTTKEWPQEIVVRTDIGIDSVEDWEGGRIGTTRFGSAGHFSAEKLADYLGWSDADYEVLPMGDLDGNIAGLRSGDIDGFMSGGIAGLQLQEEGHAVLFGNMTRFMPSTPASAVLASDTIIASNPDAVRRFCEIMYEAQTILKDDMDEGARIFMEEWGFSETLTPQMIEDTSPYLATDDEITEEMLENIAEAVVFTIDGVDELSGADVAPMYVPCSSL